MNKGIKYNDQEYRDDRMYVLNLSIATIEKNGKKFSEWSLVTYRNILQLPATRADEFKSKEEAFAYVKKTEPTVPLISCNEKPLSIPEGENEWLYWNKWLKLNNLFSALSGKQHQPFWLDKRGYNYAKNYQNISWLNDEDGFND